MNRNATDIVTAMTSPGMMAGSRPVTAGMPARGADEAGQAVCVLMRAMGLIPAGEAPKARPGSDC
ncbi:MAG: hypothetical protein AAF610_10240 [Pseudomonadota bacterium]